MNIRQINRKKKTLCTCTGTPKTMRPQEKSGCCGLCAVLSKDGIGTWGFKGEECNSQDTFWDMRHSVILSLCEHHRVCIYKPRSCSPLHTWAIWHSLLFSGYKPVQHVTRLNTVGNCNTMVCVCASKHN
uniref:Uncharacterized protein n=1 Tax=Rousettus aegyptiacus TaxID=9407 RepID=A0A7J8DI69_ROUAE|nr:hypothetical protein HJG63_008675 [Rousettus aegyptiacus]